jgi:glucosamine--fructose-6-phosphate aminotransferase (isomerizing)
MCGIFGVIAVDPEAVRLRRLERAVATALRRSESRGKDASGVLVWAPEGVTVAKHPYRGARLLRSEGYRSVLAGARRAAVTGSGFVVLGHTRMMTKGDSDDPRNNQPVVEGPIAVLHNGIIINETMLRESLVSSPEAEVDTAVLPALMLELESTGVGPDAALRHALSRIEGANTVAIADARRPFLYLGTSNGSCYILEDPARDITIFASEPRIVGAMASVLRLDVRGRMSQLRPGGLRRLALSRLAEEGPIGNAHVSVIPQRHTTRARSASMVHHDALARLLRVDMDAIAGLRRCSTCVLPETFPFVDLDGDGRCVLCRTWTQRTLRPIDELLTSIEAERRAGRAPEILVPISGGRDSCFALHHLVAELGIPAIAYTYDWGFVTDRARRNISRMCGALGVEHVLVAADLRRKRANVRRNLLAWARRPHLGAIPLLMAGDKHFFHFAGAIRRERNLSGTVFSMNWFERTDFKAGFAGVEDRSRSGRTHALSLTAKARLAAFYAGQAVRNPAYLNRSVLDSLVGFAAFYLRRQDYHQLFDFIPWDEESVNRTIIDGYGWEGAPGYSSTWRVGDGTAAFYNFAYLSVAGFTEHDALRSNQVRAGMLDRATALALVGQDNVPQPGEFADYCRTVGIPPHALVDAVRRIPTLV